MNNTLDFNSSGKSVELKGVLERPFTSFNIKGKTIENYFGQNITNSFWFNSYNNAWAREGHRILYRNATSLSGAWNEDVYIFDDGFRNSFMYPGETYTVTYRVYEYKKTGRDPDLYFKVGRDQNIHRFPYRDPGVYSFTFTAKDDCRDDWMGLRTTRGSGENNTEERVVDIEFLSIVKGTYPLKCRTLSLAGVGIEDRGIEVFTQNQNPILGKYRIQGDIAGRINKIEDKILKNEDIFTVSWI